VDLGLDRLADDYLNVTLTLNPFNATVAGVPGYDAEVPDPSRSAALAAARRLDEIAGRAGAVDPSALAPEDRTTQAVLVATARNESAQLVAALDEFAVSATTIGAQTALIATVPRAPLVSERHAADYLARCAKLGGWLDGVGERYRQAARAGRTPTESGTRQTIAQIDALLRAPVEGDPIVAATRRPDPPRDGLPAEVAELVATVVRPALQRLRTTLHEDLLPVSRPDDRVGVCHVPGGREGYAAAVRAHTTTALSPDEIHAVGVDLVRRLREELAELGGRALGTSEVDAVLDRLRHDPALRFREAGEILASATAALARANEALPDRFHTYDLAPCIVTEMSEFEATDSVLGYYVPPATDGSRPGMHCVNTHSPTQRPRFEYETLAFHESVPGHHLQAAIAQGLTELPMFRRVGYLPAYSEGWALYTERLCDEMGLYTGDLERLGMLSFDAWRACRLVVDTGMHHLGWSRQRAIDYMLANTALSPGNIANEVDRYVAWPGQALAYMIGRLRIRSLREELEAQAGPRLDLRDFHDAVLRHGAVPLDVLEAEVRADDRLPCPGREAPGVRPGS
jgi:uncharacterized protein (DUF885 family)